MTRARDHASLHSRLGSISALLADSPDWSGGRAWRGWRDGERAIGLLPQNRICAARKAHGCTNVGVSNGGEWENVSTQCSQSYSATWAAVHWRLLSPFDFSGAFPSSHPSPCSLCQLDRHHRHGNRPEIFSETDGATAKKIGRVGGANQAHPGPRVLALYPPMNRPKFHRPHSHSSDRKSQYILRSSSY